MMAEQQQNNIATPYLGMNLDDDPAAMEPGEFSFVLNAVLGDAFGANPYISNAAATEEAFAYPGGFIEINATPVDENRRVCFLVNPNTGESQIGMSDRSTYRLTAAHMGLNFKVDSQIQCKVKRSYNGDYYAYWVDFHNDIRIMNLDKPPRVRVRNADGTVTQTDELDIDQLRLFKNYELPELEIAELLNVGRIVSCGLFVAMQYADARGNGLTAWHRMSGKVAIIRDSISDAYENITGCASGLPTNKALKLHIRNADLSFSHINIGVVRVIDGVPSGFRVATVTTAQSEYIYTGANTEVPVPIAEMVVPAIVYGPGKTIEEADGSLVIGNLYGKKELNIQPYINRIQIQWQSYRVSPTDREQSHKNPLFSAYFQSQRRDEVVAVGVVIEFTDGTESVAYPMAGRSLNRKSTGQPFTETEDVLGNPINPTTWDDQVMPINDDTYENTTLPRWRVYNTASIEGSRAVLPFAPGLSKYGECGYWESTERYPNNAAVWGELAGQPIRYPRMPDATLLPLVENMNLMGMGSIPMVYHLGLAFPNIEEVMESLPDEVKKVMKGWRIVRADRRFNRSVHASGLIFNCYEQEFKETRDGDADVRVYPNYPLNDLRADPYITKPFSETMDTDGLLPTIVREKNDAYRKDIFTFLSPDTSLEKAALTNSELVINGELTGEALCYHRWVDPFPKLKEKGDENSRAALQGLALGEYKRFHTPVNGQTRRRLKEAMYIPMDSYVSGGNTGRTFWNKGRESTVMLALEKPIEDPVNPDRSRFILTNEDIDTPPNEHFDPNSENANISTKSKRPIAIHYATIKQSLPNQYGSIYNITWVETGCTKARYEREKICMGGDTYIGQFADKRQMVFYNELQDWMEGADGGDGMDLKGNASLPGVKYYYRNAGSNPRNDSKMMLEDNSGWFGGDSKDLGFLTLFMHGVPMFWVESDVNIALRLEGQLEHQAVYPTLHDGATLVQQWLGVKNIDKDNYHGTNIDLSGYNNLRYIANHDPLYVPGESARTHYETRAIKSLRSQPEDIYDNWQVFKPLDYYDFSKSRGALWDIRYVGQSRTLFRFERSLQVSSLQQSIATSEGQITLGSGRLFAQEPQELIRTDLGYAGTKSQWAFDNTEFGAFFVDTATRSVFNFANGLQAISNNKAAIWFSENLPFKLSRQLPEVPTDNAANPSGIGFTSGWDARHKLWMLTKKDYEFIEPSFAKFCQYRDGGVWHNGAKLDLKDGSIFINRSWTIGYSPITKRWFSFYSFIPDSYGQDNDSLVSVFATNGACAVYRHNSGSKMQTFYGVKAPFIVEYPHKLDGISDYVSNSASFITKAYRAKGGKWQPVRDVSFNEAVVYNSYQCSGRLGLRILDPNNLSLRKSLLNGAAKRDLELKTVGGKWNFTDYWDIAKHDDFFLEARDGALDKVLDHTALDYVAAPNGGPMIRGPWTKTRLILDGPDDLKLLFVVAIEQPRASYS
jgi:hypothetical protein